MSGYRLDDVPHKAPRASEMSRAQKMGMPVHLRPLFIMIDGKRTIRELLEMNIRGVSIESFDELRDIGMIDPPGRPYLKSMDIMVDPRQQNVNTGTSAAKGLSEVRFDVIDLLLDASSKDFGARKWVDRIERASSVDQLRELVRSLCADDWVHSNPGMQDKLLRAVM